MQDRTVGLVGDGAQQVPLLGIGIGQHAQRLIRVARDDRVVEVARALVLADHHDTPMQPAQRHDRITEPHLANLLGQPAHVFA